MTTLFRRDGNSDLELTPNGTEDEVDIHFERDDNDDIMPRATSLTMDLPDKTNVLDDDTVYDAGTGTNVSGTFANALEEYYKDGETWGAGGTEFTGTYVGGGGGDPVAAPTFTAVDAETGSRITVTVTGAAVGQTTHFHYRILGADTWTSSITVTGNASGNINSLVEGEVYEIYGTATVGVIEGPPTYAGPIRVSDGDVPAGPERSPLENFKILLADCDGFRTFTGTADQTAARAKVILSHGAITTDAEAGINPPVAFVFYGESFRSKNESIDTRINFRHSGDINVLFMREVSSAENTSCISAHSYDPAISAFTDEIDLIIRDMQALSGMSGYFCIDSIERIDGPSRIQKKDRATAGDNMMIEYRIAWGGGD